MDSTLDKEYSPSLWSTRFSNGNDVIQFHKKIVTEESNRVRDTFKYETIFYGTQSNENFDIYGINLPSNAPIVVYVHGGYWQDLSKDMSAYCVDPLVSNGFKVIVVEYDLCPKLSLSKLIEQFTKCGAFILDYADRVKCRQLTFVGHSAGAHLILCMVNDLLKNAQEPLRIHALYLLSGIYDLTELQHTSINQDNILSIDVNYVDELSPLKFDFKKWSKQRFVVKVYVAEHDSPTFINQSYDLSGRLQEEKLEVKHRLIKNCDHFDIVEKLSDRSFEISQDLIMDK